MDIKERVRHVPDSPGIYIFKDESGSVIYVGKASSLKKRVKSYFQPLRDLSPRTELMVGKIRDIEWTTTSSEAEALLFESNLIKEYRPKYNVALRDDKSYPLIKVTMAEEYPRIIAARGRKSDGSLYFGPYTDAALLRQAIKSIRKMFPFRACRPLPKKACVYYELGLCPAPCEGKIAIEDYLDNIKEIILFIEGKKDELLRVLAGKMKRLSDEERFEEAAGIRNRIEALNAAVYKKGGDVRGGLGELKEILGLKGEPRLIEAFDISNIKGEAACGSMVTFKDGRPDKSKYRMFKIREVEGQDDYAMMREVVRRRYTGTLKDKHKIPDLIIIDGGRGHLSVAADEIRKAGLAGVPVIGIAKVFEHIHTLDRDTPIALAPSSKALQLIQRVRDESHRFAIKYHHILRRKALVGDVKAKKQKRRAGR
jgi:excinuclease ABC subunit C